MKHKRNKRSRSRGKKTCGWGTKKHRNKGNKGGTGMAGTGKRADQKKTFLLRYMPDYFGKHGFKPVKKKTVLVINVGDIEKNIDSFLKEGIAKKISDGIELNLEKYKLLGEGTLKNIKKIAIKVKSASKKAIDKIEKIGGKVIIQNKGNKEDKEIKKEFNEAIKEIKQEQQTQPAQQQKKEIKKSKEV